MAPPERTTRDDDRPAPLGGVPFFAERLGRLTMIRFWHHHPVRPEQRVRYAGVTGDSPLGETLLEFMRMHRELESKLAGVSKERDELHGVVAELQGKVDLAEKQIAALKSKKPKE